MGRIKKHFKNGLGIESVKDLVEIIVGVLEIVGVIATVWSVVLVYDTLVEMRIERQYTYQPDLYFIENEYIVEAFPEFAFDYGDGDIECIQQVGFGDDRNFTVELRNVGAGTAKDVKITTSADDCMCVMDAFNETTYGKVDYENREFEGDTDIVYFSDGTCWDFFWIDEDVSYPYILPNAEQKSEYLLPSVYACLVKAFIVEKQASGLSEGDMNGSIPDLPITIEYNDIQGMHYKENAVIHTEITWLIGYGVAITISIVPTQ